MTTLRNLILLILTVFFAPLLAQNVNTDARITEIRRLYDDTNRQIEQAQEDYGASDIYLNEIVVNKGGTSYPAVGIYRKTIRFFYTFGDREYNPYPDRLIKITVTTERSARHEYAEFVFDANGLLAFAFEKDDESETRYYFSEGRLIRILRGSDVIPDPGPDEKSSAQAIVARKDALTKIFFAVEEVD